MNNKVKGDVKMTKIKIMSVRDEDMPYIKAWAEKHHVEVDITKEALTDDNVEGVAGYDGLSLSQQIPLSEHVYKRLNELGIKQIAQRSAGFDTYDLELANKYNLIVSNVPSYSPNSIAEFAVNQAINVVRHFNQIQTKVREHDFRWEPTILSKSIKDLKVAVIGTGRIGRVRSRYICQWLSKVMWSHTTRFLMLKLQRMSITKIRLRKRLKVLIS